MAKCYTAEQLYDFMTQLRCTITVGKRGEEKAHFESVLADMPLQSIHAYLVYGVQRWHNDKCGGEDVTLADKKKMVSDQLVNLYGGVVKAPRKNAVDLDPLDGFRRSAALELVNQAPAAKAKYAKADADGKTALLAAVIAKYADRVEARAGELKRLDDEKRAGRAKIGTAISLADLGL